jgi:hypothetical protein
MNQQSAIDTLVETLTAVPEYENPLNPIYEVLVQQQPVLSADGCHSSSKGPLTLQAILTHSQLLHDHADQVQDQTFAVNSVIQSCKRIPPTPLPALPLGF